MFKSIMKKITLKYRSLSALFVSKYNIACEFLGVRDSVETRVFMAVCSSVLVYYSLFLLFRVGRFVFEASSVLMAIVHQ